MKEFGDFPAQAALLTERLARMLSAIRPTEDAIVSDLRAFMGQGGRFGHAEYAGYMLIMVLDIGHYEHGGRDLLVAFDQVHGFCMDGKIQSMCAELDKHSAAMYFRPDRTTWVGGKLAVIQEYSHRLIQESTVNELVAMVPWDGVYR